MGSPSVQRCDRPLTAPQAGSSIPTLDANDVIRPDERVQAFKSGSLACTLGTQNSRVRRRLTRRLAIAQLWRILPPHDGRKPRL